MVTLYKRSLDSECADELVDGGGAAGAGEDHDVVLLGGVDRPPHHLPRLAPEHGGLQGWTNNTKISLDIYLMPLQSHHQLTEPLMHRAAFFNEKHRCSRRIGGMTKF